VGKSPASPLAMPLEEAYKVLKATPGATWDSIEQTRRALVNQLHPSRWKPLSAEKRAQALAEAKRINAAYAALSQTRCSEH
jgi:DnaJ-domain-containing protein 1